MAQRYRIYNRSRSKLGVVDDEDTLLHHLVGPGRRAIVSARQLVAVQKTPLFGAGLITYERLEAEEEEIGALVTLDAKALKARLKDIDDEDLLHELLVAALEQPAPKPVTDAIRKRLESLDEADLTPVGAATEA